MTTVPTTNLSTPAVAVAIAAHPDDVEFGCGATLAKWCEGGTVVHHVICTDGSKGTWDPTADTAALKLTRQEEQRAAARALGARGEVRFLDEVDGELGSGRDLVSAVARHLRELKPDVVLGHDPWKRYRLHPDHFHAGRLVVEGIVGARDPHFFPEHGLAPHRPQALLLFEADAPDHVEEISERHLGARCAALEAHRSQFETTHHHRLDEGEAPEAGFRRRERSKLESMGRRAGFALGEEFKLMDDL